jgi:hypothetical protein
MRSPSSPAVLSSLIKQLKADKAILVLNGTILAGLIALALYAKLEQKGYGIILLFADDFNSKRPYLGLFTSISELLWCLSAAICFFSYSLSRSMIKRRADLFILYSGIGISILLLDDVFRFTLILNTYAGIPKLLMYTVYGGAAIAYGLLFRQKILKTPYALLFISGILFIISGAADMVPLAGQGTPAMLEDGTKLLGLLNIALYFWQVCRQEVLQTLKQFGS